METYQYQQYQIDGYPVQICQRVEYDPNTNVEIVDHVQIVEQQPQQIVQQLVEAHVVEEPEEADVARAKKQSRPRTQKKFLSGNSYARCLSNGPLSRDASQLVVNHYAVYRNDNPTVSHKSAVNETSRLLGVSTRIVRQALKELTGNAHEGEPPHEEEQESCRAREVTYVELNSFKDCVRLVDERILMGIAKAFRSQIVIRDASFAKLNQTNRIYRPPNAKRKVLTLSYNGCSYKRVANSEILQKQEKSLTCPECSREFKREQALTSHVRIHKSRFCKYCGLEVRTNGKQLASSLIVHHEMKCNREEEAKRRKPITCKKCQKQFNHRASLVRHRALCSPACGHCGKTFKSRAGLNNHRCHLNLNIPNFVESEGMPTAIALLREGQAPLFLKKTDTKSMRYYSDKIAALNDANGPLTETDTKSMRFYCDTLATLKTAGESLQD